MPDVTTALEANRAALDDLIQAAEKAEPNWTTPRTPGKWSASQVTEHVARALEESAKEVAGAPTKLPTMPKLIRPIMRGLFFNRVLKNRAFPQAKTSRAMDPESGPGSPAEARARLEAALAKFDQECRARAATDVNIVSGAFGKISLEDYATFQEIHTRHHTKQIPL